MEFIPLETDNDITKGKKRISTSKSLKKEVNSEKTKKPKSKVLEKKNVKNKYKETLALKREGKALKKKIKKLEKVEEREEEEEEEKDEEEETKMDDEEEDVETEEDDDEEDEEKKEEEIFKRKCQEMDLKKKNRLFIKLKKKIHNESMIKELHPDIRGVIFPRKKRPRWCWAVFVSEAKANEALKKLIKNKEIIASKPNPYERVDQKRKEKMKTVLRKKENKKKLQNIWM